MRGWFFLIAFVVSAGAPLWAEEARPVEEIVREAKRALVTLRQADRTGEEGGGVGSGFVVGEGLIATNLHVIGEGRAVSVEWPDGRKTEVAAIHAWDRTMDLAIVEVARGEETASVPPLPLGDSDALADGASVLALGAPQGLAASVVQGVLSAQREIEGLPGVQMLQIAMPIEPGNSGGPLLDHAGRVQGLVTLRSQRTANLGFAVPVNALKVLLAKPNPVPMARWQTIGALDPKRWRPAGSEGVRWSQRAGEMRAEGRGEGFGGRALCLNQAAPPPLPYDIAVRVRLGDETGAAGLVFCSDGGDRHYGFYPTNGALRLVRFNGPDVFSWTILADVRPEAYRAGEWNDLRVRVEEGKIECFLNGGRVIESADAAFRDGVAGVCQFRETMPAFRQFRVGADLATPAAEDGREFYLRQAREMEKSAAHFRRMARQAHERAVEAELTALLGNDDEAAIDLVQAALVLAKLDNAELDIEPCRERIAALGREFVDLLGKENPPLAPRAQIERLNQFFFRENGFHGARFEYENRANSRLPEVLDDREGIPIMLCVLYMEIGRAAGLDLVGLPKAGHFVVGWREPGREQPVVIDVYEGGEIVEEPETAALPPARKRDIIARMTHNLQAFALAEDARADALAYASLGVALQPADVRLRLSRAALALDQQDAALAGTDLDWLENHRLDEQEAAMLERLRAALPPR